MRIALFPFRIAQFPAAVLLWVLSSWALPGLALAQYAVDPSTSDSSSGITVFGTAEVRARPNMVEIDLRAASKAELTEDAIIKYRDVKKRTLESFAGLKMDNLKV